MKVIALAKKEAADILTNRIYLLVVFVQIFIILGAFGLCMVSSVMTNPDLLERWGATSSLKVGMSQDLEGSILARNLEEEKLNVLYYDDIKKARTLVGSELIALVEVSQPQEDVTVQVDTSNIFYPIVSQKIKDATDKFKLEKKLISAGTSESEIQRLENPIVIKEIKINQKEEAKLALDTSYFVQIMYGFVVPFVLILPFFLACNIVTDSIVGERERKTFEVLLMTPLLGFEVIAGKILPILSFSILQSLAWILLLNFLRVPIYNVFFLFFILFFVGLGFIGIGIILSMLVDSTKEANSAITLVLVFATFFLFIPLFVKASFFDRILNFIPTVLMVKLSSSPTFQPDLIHYFIPTALMSIIIFLTAVGYFKHERAIRL